MRRISFLLTATLILSISLSACSAGTFIPQSSTVIEGPLGLVYQVLMAIAGVALLVAGYKIFENLLQFIGFLMGAVIGSLLGTYLFDAILWQVVAFFVGGLIGMMIISSMLYLVIGLYGFAMGAVLLGGPLTQLFPLDLQFLGLLIGGVIGAGVLALLFRIWVSAFTAAIGAGLIVMVLSLNPAYWFVLFLGGLLIQYLQKDNQ